MVGSLKENIFCKISVMRRGGRLLCKRWSNARMRVVYIISHPLWLLLSLNCVALLLKHRHSYHHPREVEALQCLPLVRAFIDFCLSFSLHNLDTSGWAFITLGCDIQIYTTAIKMIMQHLAPLQLTWNYLCYMISTEVWWKFYVHFSILLVE